MRKPGIKTLIKGFASGVGVLLIASSLGACRGDDAAQSAEASVSGGLVDTSSCPPSASVPVVGDTIDIGVTAPLSGPLVSISAGADMFAAYIDKVNANGGVQTVDGAKKIAVDIRDDQFTPSTTQQQVRDLVQSTNVVAMASMVGSAPSGAVAPYLNQQCVPQLWSLAFANSGVSESTPFSTQITTYGTKTMVLANYLKQKYPGATVGLIYQVGDLGTSVNDALVAGLAGSDLSIISTQTSQQADTTVQGQMTTLLAAKPDIVIFAVTGPQCTQVVNAITTAGATPHLFDANGCTTSSIAAADDLSAVTASGGLFTPAQFEPLASTDAAATDYRALAAERGIPLTNTTQFGYINAYLTVATLEQAKTLTRAGIAEAAQNLRVESVPLVVDGIGFDTGTVGTAPIRQQSISSWNVEAHDYLTGDITGTP